MFDTEIAAWHIVCFESGGEATVSFAVGKKLGQQRLLFTQWLRQANIQIHLDATETHSRLKHSRLPSHHAETVRVFLCCVLAAASCRPVFAEGCSWLLRSSGAPLWRTSWPFGVLLARREPCNTFCQQNRGFRVFESVRQHCTFEGCQSKVYGKNSENTHSKLGWN